MGATDFISPNPYEDIARRLADLEDKANNPRPLVVPVLSADPGTDYKGNLWMFPDGRLHLRFNDGTVREFTSSATSGATSSSSAPSVTPAPRTYSKTYSPVWMASYKGSGSSRSGDYLWYGYVDSTNGRQKSLIGYDYATIATDLSGSTISSVSLTIHNIHSYYFAGATIGIGAHNNSSAPGSVGGSGSDIGIVSSDLYKREDKHVMAVAKVVGERLRDGTSKGVTFLAPSDSLSYYGYASKADPPLLTIVYVK